MSKINTEMSALMQTYNRFPLTLTKGKGSYVWDEEGASYLDFTSGIAVCNLGHVPEEVKHAVSEQLEQLWHCSNLFHIPAQEKAARLLCGNDFDEAFFCNSGAEANEAAWKLARKYMYDQNKKEKTDIISFTHSFHGRTGGAMAATAQEKVHTGFTPLMPGFSYLPFNEETVTEKINPEKTAAVMLELIQGEGGVRAADKSWVNNLAEFCSKNDILLIIDEIQTGAGRTGTLFAYEQYSIKPDILTAAKGIGSGFPAGAMLAPKNIAASFNHGTHGTTFGGNPLSMTAVYATISAILEPGFLEDVKNKGMYFQKELQNAAAGYEVEIRGSGLMTGMAFKETIVPLIDHLRKNGVLALPAGPDVLRILPPLTASYMELSAFADTLKQSLNEWKEGE
ncbi:acetylornithine transaminase [Alkalicoccus halolimnae]|uniref:Acetylornithine aminotransferase n=1 Tax=Alkalicoccus halolimnae TaxID=1667239 RepID=A0A5C7FMK6_9BACI|nr:acetylornithine transaminase [Alkalicoccus halolimnae]TXF87209.1 acetylornithine transaminase [Alkalicoccus halolimnae]